MSVLNQITCVWEASIDALKVAASSLTFKCLEPAAQSVHVKIPATARSRDGMGSLLAMHLSISIEKEKYMAGGVLSSAAKMSLLSCFREFLLSLSKALQGQPSEKKTWPQKLKDKREYDDLWARHSGDTQPQASRCNHHSRSLPTYEKAPAKLRTGAPKTKREPSCSSVAGPSSVHATHTELSSMATAPPPPPASARPELSPENNYPLLYDSDEPPDDVMDVSSSKPKPKGKGKGKGKAK
ncbi:hypothetical protein M407DRAFT_27953 [Tulasnella calospora MUT 4182]|uniref:Uncharacterized protein n=1 Tax=Tulasnella calospora MUT 4182 TaxID=1051891 RepID=A0A0C3Q2B3_9AGAM|nr:hypothetical protein M407DRAFT_27953 [Tulasnella calospora MUT 4182]